ncbi:MAG: hypothetical protein ACOZCO_06860 [Bacteroidota bacterium]
MIIGKIVIIMMLACIVLATGMFLLAKAKKDNLGKFYSSVAYGIISFAFLILLLAPIAGCMHCCMKKCKDGGKCGDKKECKMKCEDEKECSMKGGSCSMEGSCPMMGGGASCHGGGDMKSCHGGAGMMCEKKAGGACCDGHGGATETHEIIIEKKIDDAPANKDAKKTVEVKVDGK